MASYTPKYSVLKYRNRIFEGRCPATRTSKDKKKADGTVHIALYYQMTSASASASATVIEHGPHSLNLLGNAPLFMDILCCWEKAHPSTLRRTSLSEVSNFNRPAPNFNKFRLSKTCLSKFLVNSNGGCGGETN